MPRLCATGRLDAVVAIADLPAAAAGALLPPGLEPIACDLMPAGRHPLILLFGEHRRVGVQRLPFGLRYRELVIALPCVRPRGGPPGPFCHLPLLLLDRWLPTLLGRRLYGFAKRRAALRRSSDSFDASLPDGTPLLAARFRPTAMPADLGPVQGWFEQPLISLSSGDRWRHSRFDFGFARARLGGAEAEVRVHPDLLAGLPAGPIRPSTAFRIETAWTLERLPDCGQ